MLGQCVDGNECQAFGPGAISTAEDACISTFNSIHYGEATGSIPTGSIDTQMAKFNVDKLFMFNILPNRASSADRFPGVWSKKVGFRVPYRFLERRAWHFCVMS